MINNIHFFLYYVNVLLTELNKYFIFLSRGIK
nr:MAG TPA: hypothetical protein [Caudoviricetes sp.]